MWETASGNICINLEATDLDENVDFDLDFVKEELKKGRMSLCVSIPRKEFDNLIKDF